VALVANGTEAAPDLPYYDPTVFFAFSPLWRCCLVRTLLSYDGRPTDEGGADLHPDLAAALPDISPDGLTYTFRLKPDVHYAPPLADRIIEARDFVTALEYGVRHGDPLPGPIVGLDDFREGRVDSIAGIEARDATTLVVHLAQPSGEFPNYMATAPTAPIPEEAVAEREELGYAGFLVASGPYMYEHAADVDLADAEAPPIWELHDGPVVLVRNPSWSAAADPLRGAYVDRIELRLTDDPDKAADLVESGGADLMGEPTPLDIVNRYLATPELQGRVFTQSSPRVHYLAMNVAVPPFDDAHVRRAVNWVLDRAAIVQWMEEDRGVGFVVARHGIPDSLLNNLLLDYAPYPSSGDHGDLRAAQDEMRESRYDADGDGVCDAPACEAVSAVFFSASGEPNDVIVRNLAELGIRMEAADLNPFDPRDHVAMSVEIGWGVDLPRADNFSGLLIGSGLADGEANISLLGAPPERLEAWGYAITAVPTIDPAIRNCLIAIGSQSFECWAGIDQLVMERVVPWAPLGFAVNGWITSDRVAAFSADVYGVGPSLDRIQLRREP
jgi:extracellular solute-binding protein (family 5)